MVCFYDRFVNNVCVYFSLDNIHLKIYFTQRFLLDIIDLKCFHFRKSLTHTLKIYARILC